MMSRVSNDYLLPSKSDSPQEDRNHYEEDFLLKRQTTHQQTELPQQVNVSVRSIPGSEQAIIDIINKCFSSWHGPWKQSFLDGGPKFEVVFDLMEGLMHYENQILCSSTDLTSERITAIAKAVARLIDYGNAILDIDIVIRSSDETFRELNPSTLTTISLYKAHIRAHKLRNKLLDNYFERNKQDLNDADYTANNSPSSTLRVPHSASWNFPSPTMDRSHRFSIGSNTSINTLGSAITSSLSDGRKTPQMLSSTHIEVKTMSSTEDLTESQLEMKHMIATIRSKTFSEPGCFSTRYTLLKSVIEKIENLLRMPATTEKLNDCFELMDALLDTIERLPSDIRKEEVRLISNSLLKTLVRKVYIDERDSCVEFQHSYWATYLLSIIRMMTASDYEAYLKTFNNQPDLSSFLKDYLFIIKRLFMGQTKDDGSIDMMDKSSEPIYPNCWIEMSLLQCQTFLKSLICLYQILRQHFGSNTQMWHSYLECLVYFILQDVLSSSKRILLKERQRLVADMRKTSAEYIWITWDSINSDQRYEILDDIIEPMLKACMRLDSCQRSILLPIFYDMMQCDYSCQYMSSRGTICNDGDSLGGKSMSDQLDKGQSPFIEEDSMCHKMDVSRGSIYLTPPTIYSDNVDDPDESLPYLSFRDQNGTSVGFQSSGNDGTVLTKFTHLIVVKLYTLMIDHNMGDEQFKDELCATLAGELDTRYAHHGGQKSTLVSCANENDLSQFNSMARHTSELIGEFMQICLDIREANRLSYSHLRLLCLFRMILFFRDKVDRIELYLLNLHKLWRLHHAASRYIEAGFTLLDHAKTLPWTNKPLESHYRIMTRSFQSPVTDYTSLKLSLYTTIIEYFDQGQLWEAAVPLCRELVDIYQFVLFDYEKLAQIFARLSKFFANISSGQLRSQPEYFRVSFFGVGFPASLRNVTVIYRGKPFEKLGDFCATLLSKYPDASLLKTLNRPDEDLLAEPDAKYLQVNACTPMVDLKSRFTKFTPPTSASFSSMSSYRQQTETTLPTVTDIGELHESILAYYKHNECDKFEFSRRMNPLETTAYNTSAQRGGDDDFANMWRERITLTTNSLPGMLPFFPVFLTEISTLNPIACAIEDLERANDRLVNMVNRFKADKNKVEDVRPLGQLLLGIVDAAVNGGITKYEEAFFNTNIGTTTTSKHHTAHIKQQHHISHQDNANKNQLTGETHPGDYQAIRGPPSTPTNDALKLVNDGVDGVESESKATNSTVSILNNKHEQANINGTTGSPFATATTRDSLRLGERRCEQAPTFSQLEKLKCLIARQVPLLDEAIRLHSERVADIMRPQHDHLEASFKRLRNHVVSKYYRYLDKSDYARSTNTARSFRSFARSPNRSIRSESRISLGLSSASSSATLGRGFGRFGRKRLSDVSGNAANELSQLDPESNLTDDGGPAPAATYDNEPKASSIPYKQLINERRSLPFLSGLSSLSLTSDGQHIVGSPPRPTTEVMKNGESNPMPPPLPSRQGRTLLNQQPIAQLPPTAFYQPDEQVSGKSAYVCLEDVMHAFGGLKGSNPYIRLLPDNDDGLATASTGRTPKGTKISEEDQNEPTLVT